MPILSDLSQCQPATALARASRPGTWRLIDYQTTEFAGTMVYAGPGLDAPELALPLHCSGYHAIYLGVHYPGQFGDAHVRVRLSSDRAYTLVRAESQSAKDLDGIPAEFAASHTSKAFADYQLSEAFWKIADLRGQALHISRFNEGGRGQDYAAMYSNLAHVRLEPLSPAQIAAYEQELPRSTTRTLIAMNDAGIFSELRTKEDIWAQLEPYADSDVDIMLWATFKGETCTYRSQIARPLPPDGNPYDRFSSHEHWETALAALEGKGIDFMREIASAAHAYDLRIFPSLRLQGPKPVPVELEPGSFYERHPEFRCRGRDGQPIAHLSLAFAEVRAHWISLLCEALSYGFDGVHIIFCRSWPFVLYEDPVIAHYRAAYGTEPGDEEDPRLWRTFAHFVNLFARELKAAVGEMEQKLGKKLAIAYNTNTTHESNLRWGIDVETLVAEGLIDYLMPHPTFAKSAADWLPPLAALVKDTPVKLYPDLYPRRQPPAAALYSAQTLYDLGADGLTFWDTYSRVYRISEWAMMKRLGHREEIALWREQGRGDDYFRVLDFKWLGDRSGDPRFFQTNG
tara:strand:- start:116 stop:1825 length:1710 start_codon:yes stop_codon:yes gene_type:complete